MSRHHIIIITIAVLFAIVVVGYLFIFSSVSPFSRASADVTVSFLDNPVTVGVGEEGHMRIEIDPNSTSGTMSGLEFTLEYDADEAVLVPGQQPPVLTPDTFNTLVLYDLNPSPASGKQELRIVYVMRSCDLKSGPFIVSVPFLAQKEGTVDLKLKDLKLVGPSRSYSYALTTDTAKQSTKVVVGGSGEISLDMKLRFQGVVAEPENNSIRVGVSARGGPSANNSPYIYSDFTAGEDGVWSGTVRLPSSVVPGSGYRILVKGPHHLAKRVCVSEPSEELDGAYSCSDGEIELVTGDNALDFSGIFMLTGDLPLPQNGVLDSEDFVLIQQNLSSVDPGAVGRGDMNQDGIVDAQDYSALSYSRSSNEDDQ